MVEDEGEIRQLIVLHLKREGFDVDAVEDGEEARQLVATRNYDLIVLDWMLPSLSGLELTRWVRKRSPSTKTPILFVTAKTEPEHVATGLDAGADDYLSKPFDTLVLMARVNALLRRQEWLQEQPSSSASARLILGDLVMNTHTFEVTVAGAPLELTRSEFRLLESLMMNQGKVLSRESLIEEIQGEGVNVVGRTVDTHVFGLRKKLGAYADVIETIRGVGYRVRYLPPQN
ncbi:MAG: response regulator transcription factor [Bdellovibrionales bacterium]|nr:response regulator transcription factor [Bdellovibrionales bacterium]